MPPGDEERPEAYLCFDSPRMLLYRALELPSTSSGMRKKPFLLRVFTG
jgi:hypothetical protein